MTASFQALIGGKWIKKGSMGFFKNINPANTDDIVGEFPACGKEEVNKAVAAAKVAIRPKDTVLLHMDFFRRAYGTEGYLTDFPGLTKESATWLARQGIGMFGVEAVSPGRPGRNNFEVHHVCRDHAITHMEGLVNLDKLVGKGRFRFIGFPLKIKGGTGSPIRAVAWLEG